MQTPPSLYVTYMMMVFFGILVSCSVTMGTRHNWGGVRV